MPVFKNLPSCQYKNWYHILLKSLVEYIYIYIYIHTHTHTHTHTHKFEELWAFNITECPPLNTVRTHWCIYEEHTEKQEDGNLPLPGSDYARISGSL